MNHSKAFWAVRNKYAEDMRLLCSRGFIGEGLWGRGALLETGEWEKNSVQPGEALPEHLCGGTYRSRGRKRKAKKTLSYQEQKERRIRKKFGAGGVAVGEDKETKKKLEKGRSVAAKPRVAGSARGRELRAAAALARFEKGKEESSEAEVKTERDADVALSGSESGSGEDYDDDDQPDARDLDGSNILDESGRKMIKVCEDENPGDQDVQNELHELRLSMQKQPGKAHFSESQDVERKPVSGSQEISQRENGHLGKSVSKTQLEKKAWNSEAEKPTPERTLSSYSKVCPICSFANAHSSPTCSMCANVLDADSVVGSWRCQSQACAGSAYLNAGDCGVCGVCNERRVVSDSSTPLAQAAEKRSRLL